MARESQRPARTRSEVQDVAQRERKRNREVAAVIPLALAPDRHVHGDDERFVAGSLRPIDQAVEKRLVAQDVGLEPQPAGRLARDPLDRCRRRARQRVGNSESGGRARDRDVGARPPEPCRAGGGR
jgi:hypothetical protein